MSEIQVPATVKVAIALLFVGSLVNVVSSRLTPTGLRVGPASVVGLIVGAGMAFLVLWAIYRGYKWVRILLTVLSAIGVVLVFFGLVTRIPGYTVLDLVGVVASDVGVVLLWLVPSRQFFDVMKASRLAAAPTDDPPSDAWKLPYSGE
jgi:hypothetical protein